MGPFPHDAPPARISADNPAGTDGFEFVEFADANPDALKSLFERMGFARVARHRSRPVDLYRQGGVNYLLNADEHGFAGQFVRQHGPCAPAMAWRVVDADHAFAHAIAHGARSYLGERGEKTIDAPAIVGVGGSLIYFIDRFGVKGSPYADEFDWIGEPDPTPTGAGLTYIDHLTHNVHRGQMDRWSEFYKFAFNFRQIRFFDIEGRKTGLFSRALTSPCGRIRIPINESADDKSQIEEFLRAYKGEGIQHIACGSDDAYKTVRSLAAKGLAFMPPPPQAYYDKLAERLPHHGEPLEELRASGLLLDGEVVEGEKPKLLLQIFSTTVIGPIFFEFIQRKGDEGFGEGNFKALFESIEEDQIRRGVLTA
ncbi:4-hydroxyphenylpyruvate dioxygenase [Methylocapsa palsarum]|uniref:4-hydroxyphenylpyruvate dioxygenase n=1 Tax=Methylocapsa palsarum TaxID=1612308 RepID=A0A1I3YFN9_9HYPH|nr:4-hydroxyphenylpyruvate dioxygenase [Methylocapsa palsarum]SFK30016.1 4-hydroxyphenylpyruvate dioxygenase [Methylocapsa palsarum]